MARCGRSAAVHDNAVSFSSGRSSVHVLFIHQNILGQFGHLILALCADPQSRRHLHDRHRQRVEARLSSLAGSGPDELWCRPVRAGRGSRTERRAGSTRPCRLWNYPVAGGDHCCRFESDVDHGSHSTSTRREGLVRADELDPGSGGRCSTVRCWIVRLAGRAHVFSGTHRRRARIERARLCDRAPRRHDRLIAMQAWTWSVPVCLAT